jgi:hypothetical protein
MDQLKNHIIDKLRQSRLSLLDIPKDQLTGDTLGAWRENWDDTLKRADTVSGLLLPINVNQIMLGFWSEQDNDVCLILRTRIIELIDQSIRAVDAQQVVKPVLDDLISKVADTKLATLLHVSLMTFVSHNPTWLALVSGQYCR